MLSWIETLTNNASFPEARESSSEAGFARRRLIEPKDPGSRRFRIRGGLTGGRPRPLVAAKPH